MEKTLSLIIPTYNMERYLDYCLSSLIVDGQLMDMLEVLVVNDGSKDRSSEIAHGYEARYPAVFRVIDKDNGNYGSCVNVGVREATGKYVKVLDADDSFDTQNFAGFLAFMKDRDEDLILSDFDIVNEERIVQKEVRYPFEGEKTYKFSEIGSTEAFGLMEMHAVTYKRAKLLEMDYRQTEGISFTDQQWIFAPMTQIETICFYARPVYKYLVGRAGQTMDPAIQAKQKSQLIKCLYGMVDAYSVWKNKVDESHLAYLHARLRPLVKGVYLSCFTNHKGDGKQLLAEFDETLRSKDMDLYNYIGSHDVSSIAGFDYIAFWRKHYKSHQILTGMFYSLITLLLKIK